MKKLFLALPVTFILLSLFLTSSAQAAANWNTQTLDTVATHVQFSYPSNWTAGAFATLPNQLTLQPTNTFNNEAENKAIIVSIGSACLNTQCLSVIPLRQQIKDMGAKIIRRASIKGATGYYVRTVDKKFAYIFLKGNEEIIVKTDVYTMWMKRIAQTMRASSNVITTKKRVCPDAWYDNQMPGIVGPSEPPRQYLVINGKRAELADYDIEWIKNNCQISKPTVLY